MPDLNRRQFTQEALPGMPAMPMGQQHVGPGNPVPEAAKQRHVESYHGTFGADSPAHGRPKGHPDVVPNPIHDPEVFGKAMNWDRANLKQSQQQGESYPYEQASLHDEMVPTWKVTSPQPEVNRSAIEHISANANIMSLSESPIMAEYSDLDTGETGYMVEDGNHRVNAAQRQGRLFIPSHVNAWRPRSR